MKNAHFRVAIIYWLFGKTEIPEHLHPSHIHITMIIENDDILNSKDFTIKYTELKDIRLVKTNGYGLIKKGFWQKNNQSVALKYITVEEGISKNIIDLKKTSPNIVECLGISQDPENKNYLLVLEYFEKNLRDYLSNHDLEWNRKIQISKDIANGINFIHNEIKMVHQNLSTKVVFLNNDKALILDPRIFTIATESSSGYYDSLNGSVAFVDPNVLKNPKTNYTTKSDIYSFGVIMWEISSGKIPFSDVKESRSLLTEIINNNLQEVPIPGTPPEYVELYKNCWLEPEKRPDILSIYNELEKMLEHKEFEDPNYAKEELENVSEYKIFGETNEELGKESEHKVFEDHTSEKLEIVSERKVFEDPINEEIHSESSEINTQASSLNDISKNSNMRKITSEKPKKTFCQRVKNFISNIRSFTGKLLICRPKGNRDR